jgi:type IV secretory pathway VirB3-like protein
MTPNVMHLVSLVFELITLGLLLYSLHCIRRLCKERDEAVKSLMLYMDQKTREINAHNGGRHSAE